MTTLPLSPLPTDTVTINGTDVPIRSLSRAEALRLQSFKGQENDAERYIVACAAGVTEDEAGAWLASVDVDTGGLLIDGILALSGLTDPQKGSRRT